MSDTGRSRLLSAFWGEPLKQSALEETLRVTASVREKLREKEASIERKEAVTANAYAALLSILEERAGVITDLERRIERVNHFLSANGCDCECDHSAEDHDDDCARCVACVIDGLLNASPAGVPASKKDRLLALEAELASSRSLYDRAMDEIHRAAGITRNGLAGILGWIEAAKEGEIEPAAKRIRGYEHALMFLSSELRRESRRRPADEEPGWMDAMPILNAYAAEQISGGRARELLRFWVRGATHDELVEALPRDESKPRSGP